MLPQIADTPRESGTHSDPLLDCEAFIRSFGRDGVGCFFVVLKEH
jgi:hypothetical protein